MKASNDHQPEVLASLSAMFDGEATDQDIDSLLNKDSAFLSQQLESFHLIQQVLHKDSEVSVGLEDTLVSRIRVDLERDSSMDSEFTDNMTAVTSQNVVPMIQSMDNLSSAERKIRPVWQSFFSGMAVAASVAFVVVLGGNTLLTPNETVPAFTAKVEVAKDALVATPLSELNQNALKVDNIRLQNYLRQHAEQATVTVGQGMIPMARVASYTIKE